MIEFDRGIGLYISIDDDGTLTKSLVNEQTTIEMGKTTIREEIFDFTDSNMKYYNEIVELVISIADSINLDDDSEDVSQEKAQKLYSIVDCLVEELVSESPLWGILLKARIEDVFPWRGLSYEEISHARILLPLTLSAIVTTHEFLNRVIYNAYSKNSLEDFAENYLSTNLLVQQEVCFHNELKTRYFFRSLPDYYCFLMMHFLNSKPKILRCSCCGRFFVPKTNKVTKYCDRIVKNGKTCKAVAPKLKHKVDASNDIVIETYDKEKHKRYLRRERHDGEIYMSPKGMSLQDYFDWDDAATLARNRYLHGEISADEALKIITAE